MAEIVVHPKAMARAVLYDYLSARVGPIKATKWLFSGCDALDGQSPLESMKAGADDEVEDAAAAFVVEMGFSGKLRQ